MNSSSSSGDSNTTTKKLILVRTNSSSNTHLFLLPQEAQALSSLKKHFEAKRVPLYAVLHEELGAEEFRKFFDGELFLDVERRFYGPEERRMLVTGMLRWSVWSNLMRASNKGVEGNLKGDGSLLGSECNLHYVHCSSSP